MADVYIPRGRCLGATDTAQQITFGVGIGAITIANFDTANDIYYAFDKTAVADDTTDDNFKLPANCSKDWDRIKFNYISVVCGTGLTALVRVDATVGDQS